MENFPVVLCAQHRIQLVIHSLPPFPLPQVEATVTALRRTDGAVTEPVDSLEEVGAAGTGEGASAGAVLAEGAQQAQELPPVS